MGKMLALLKSLKSNNNMKTMRFTIIFSGLICALFIFQNCSDSSSESEKDVTINILQSKSWTTSSVMVPDNTATESNDWLNFKVSFTGTNMSASDHAAGAEAVWPSGSYTVSEDGKQITRGDGVLMILTNLTDSSFTVIFSVPPGTEIGGRIAALDGEYIFNMN